MAYDPNVVKTILSIGSGMGMSQKQLIAGLAGGLVESGLRNVNYGDRDSLGVFQQRPSQGWGSPTQVRDVEYASRKFFSELKRVWDDGRSIGANVQAVQRSAFPDRYDQRLGEARKIFQQFGNEVEGVEVPIGTLPDADSLASDVLGINPTLSDDFDDLDDGDGYDIEQMWNTAIQTMGDEVRGQFDPNGDLFDEEGDVDELVSADEYDRMLSGQESLVAGGDGLELELDADEIGGTLASEALGASDAQRRAQEEITLANAAQNRQRAFDVLDAMAGSRTSMGKGGSIGPSSNASIPSGLRSNASAGARVARQLGFSGTIGGIGQRGYKSDHPNGDAIDLMTGLSKRGQANGWKLANYYHANRANLNVKYIIFDGKIASARDNWKWRPYGGTPDGNASDTALHRDHVHLSFY